LSSHPSRCLVTGGAGFIGSHVVDRLLALGTKSVWSTTCRRGRRENLAHVADRIDFQLGDLCDPADAARAVDGIEVIYHFAALPSVPRSLKDPWGSHDANVNATCTCCRPP
jgi:UDP-glucose 4-epimerase